jgi:Tat protein translocase TatC
VAIFSWRKKTKRGPDQNPEEMGFFDHLEELRWHLMRSVIAIVVFAIALFIYRTEIIGGVFMAPFRYDFITYRMICEHVSSDFCPPADEGSWGKLETKSDSVDLVGVMNFPANLAPFKGAVLSKDGNILVQDSSGTFASYPVTFKMSVKDLVQSGQVGGFKMRTKHGEMVSIQATSPYEQFMKALIYAFFAGLILAFPYVMWEVWRFIKPALSKREASRVKWNVFSTSILFFIGVAFGYFVILPTSVLFLAQFVLFEEAENIWRIGDVINFELTVLFGTGLVFQLPLVVYYLSLIGIVTPKFLRKYRRHSIVILLTLAAIITPSPDPFSQLLVFAPLMILYELSIFISARVERRKKAEEAAEKENEEKRDQEAKEKNGNSGSESDQESENPDTK